MIKNLRHLNSSSRLIAVTLMLSAVVAGCKKAEQPPAVPSAQAPANQPINQATKPVQKAVSSVGRLIAPPPPGNQFDFSSKKDPFKPFVVVKAVSAPSTADLKKAAQDGLPIHSFDVSQFRMIGLITGAKENQAMVVDPNGKGYVLKVGMTIGKNDGRITSISNSGVDVLEQFKDDNGRVRKENIRITLPRKQ